MKSQTSFFFFSRNLVKMQFSTFLLIDVARFLSSTSYFLVILSNRSRDRFIIHLECL